MNQFPVRFRHVTCYTRLTSTLFAAILYVSHLKSPVGCERRLIIHLSESFYSVELFSVREKTATENDTYENCSTHNPNPVVKGMDLICYRDTSILNCRKAAVMLRSLGGFGSGDFLSLSIAPVTQQLRRVFVPTYRSIQWCGERSESGFDIVVKSSPDPPAHFWYVLSPSFTKPN